MQDGFTNPDSRALTAAPSIHATAVVRDTSLGRFCKIGPRCRIADFGALPIEAFCKKHGVDAAPSSCVDV